MKEFQKILISRTDAIGDLLLTLPMVDVIKQNFPNTKVYILGQGNNQPIVQASLKTDGFLNWTELAQMPENEAIKKLKEEKFDVIIHVFPNKKIAKIAKKAKIPYRIGTSRRFYHWLTCNKSVNLSRKKSDLHETQLNLKLLKPLKINTEYDLQQLEDFGKIKPFAKLPFEVEKMLNKEKQRVIIHPKSKGSARNWDIQNFVILSKMLIKNGFDVYVTGTEEEGNRIKQELGNEIPNVYNITGQLNLAELITFISKCDALVAASTGPLHIASAVGINAVGIYPPIRPMHPGRWRPIGKDSSVLCIDKECDKCRKSNFCECMQAITPEMVFQHIKEYILIK